MSQAEPQLDNRGADTASRQWVVLKYGGTSVTGSACWDRIALRIGELMPDFRVWITVSALSQVSNRLEQAIQEALHGEQSGSYDWIEKRHREIAEELGLDDAECAAVEELLGELDRLLEGVRLTREAPPRLRARILSFGELASTRLGIRALAKRGIEARLLDARRLMTSAARTGEPESKRYLDATVPFDLDACGVEGEAEGARVVLTQGFIAGTPKGETCLLGRGGSDTSAALFAALLRANRVEIWTDVHGMFTADPRTIPSARLIREIGYREARELAAMGAKVLHPGCLDPIAQTRIPLEIHNSHHPGAPGTRISSDAGDDPAVMAVVRRTGVTLLSLSTLDMWGAPGFLARAFEPFEQTGISVDLVATSQSAVSVTLDGIPGGVDGEHFAALLQRLQMLGETRVVHPCAVVSVVGRRIRTVLHELGPALAVFREHNVHMVSESSEDLNLSFVVDEDDAVPLVRNLHAQLFPPPREGERSSPFGDSWERLTGQTEKQGVAAAAEVVDDQRRWWHGRREQLLALVADGRARYVYDLGVVRARAAQLRDTLGSVREWFFSMKANPHPRILSAIASMGIGMECVSAGEIALAREICGSRVPLLFTPNFCPLEEYLFAREKGAEITVDGPHLLEQAPEQFRGTEAALRLDPGGGLGHHEKVRTAGGDSKFGHPLEEIEDFLETAARLDVAVVGLHSHLGSGIVDPEAWACVGEKLMKLMPLVPQLRWIDLGGGLGVADVPGLSDLDLSAVESSLARLLPDLGNVALRMEPGRFLVSEAGVLLAPVTQVRRKRDLRFIGVATGMNSLLRPAMYGAWHSIHNLTRMDEPPADYAHVVGPICESGDVIGRDRLLPRTRPGDILLLENCGAYGAVMASRYNLREPADEIVLD